MRSDKTQKAFDAYRKAVNDGLIPVGAGVGVGVEIAVLDELDRLALDAAKLRDNEKMRDKLQEKFWPEETEERINPYKDLVIDMGRELDEWCRWGQELVEEDPGVMLRGFKKRVAGSDTVKKTLERLGTEEFILLLADSIRSVRAASRTNK